MIMFVPDHVKLTGKAAGFSSTGSDGDFKFNSTWEDWVRKKTQTRVYAENEENDKVGGRSEASHGIFGSVCAMDDVLHLGEILAAKE